LKRECPRDNLGQEEGMRDQSFCILIRITKRLRHHRRHLIRRMEGMAAEEEKVQISVICSVP